MGRLKEHILPDCLLVWYTPYLKPKDIDNHGEEICEQGWADLKLNGINKAEAQVARSR